MTDTVHVDGPQSQALATTSGPSTVIDTIRSAKFKQEIQAALPESVSPDRFARVAITALLQNPSIQNASRESVLNSLLRCAQDGLLPDGQQAALVMFQNKAQYMPMVGGYRQIAAEHGWSLRTFLVYENDAFDYELGPNPLITH
jgi:recombination protein RecT